MEDRRWNHMIDLINAGKTAADLNPPIRDKEEERIFTNMAKQLAEMREKYPDARLANVDSEWGVIGDSGLYD